jgi:hypothetical protein
MSNLKSLTFLSGGGLYVSGYRGPASTSGFESFLADPSRDLDNSALEILKKAIEDQTSELTGLCACRDRDGYCSDDLPDDSLRRKVIAVWQFLGKPYKLRAEIEFDLDHRDWKGSQSLHDMVWCFASSEGHDC